MNLWLMMLASININNDFTSVKFVLCNNMWQPETS